MKIFTPQHIAELLEEGYVLKKRLDEKVSDAEYDPSFHVGRRYREVCDELAEIQQAEGMERLEHGGIVFRLNHVNGHPKPDLEQFIAELTFRGVSDAVIRTSLSRSFKQTKDYWTKEIS